MFFRGFRASLNLNGKKHYDAIEFESANPICGAYRMNRDEFYSDNPSELMQHQSSFIFEPPPPLRPSKSINNLTTDLTVTLRKKEVSTNPKGAEHDHQRNSRQDREPRKPEKDRTSKNKQETKQSSNKKSKAPPIPPPLPIDTGDYSNNLTEKLPITRIDSSIDRSLKTTGPLPYDLVSDKLEVIPNRYDVDIENASFRQNSDDNRNIIEPVARERKTKKSFLDLKYNMDDKVNIHEDTKEELV